MDENSQSGECRESVDCKEIIESSVSADGDVESAVSADGDAKAGIVKKVYRKRKASAAKREQQRQNLLIEAVVLIGVIVIWQTVGKTGALRHKSHVLSYEEQAVVISVMDCEFSGTKEQAAEIGEAADAKYAVLIEYFAGNQRVRKYLYFKEEPSYRAGDEILVRVSVFDKQDISIVQ